MEFLHKTPSTAYSQSYSNSKIGRKTEPHLNLGTIDEDSHDSGEFSYISILNDDSDLPRKINSILVEVEREGKEPVSVLPIFYYNSRVNQSKDEVWGFCEECQQQVLIVEGEEKEKKNCFWDRFKWVICCWNPPQCSTGYKCSNCSNSLNVSNTVSS